MKNSYNMSRKDVINANSATALQKLAGEVFTITGCAIDEKPDSETGEVKEVAILATTEYGAVASISTTVIKSIDEIIDYMTDEHLETLDVKVVEKTSNSGRKYYMLQIM